MKRACIIGIAGQADGLLNRQEKISFDQFILEMTEAELTAAAGTG